MGGKWDRGRGRRGQGREEGRTPPPMSEVHFFNRFRDIAGFLL